MPYDPDSHGPRRIVGPGFHARVYEVVRRVPAGSVTTYGDVGAALGSSRVARHVGHALAALPARRGDVPWFRVVSARGAISFAPADPRGREQVRRLSRDGIEVDSLGRIVDFRVRRFRFESD